PCVTTPIVPDAHLSVPSHGHHRDLHSSPTRRSSDLPGRPVPATRPGDHRRRRPERAATRTPGSGCPAGRASSSRPARLRTKLPAALLAYATSRGKRTRRRPTPRLWRGRVSSQFGVRVRETGSSRLTESDVAQGGRSGSVAARRTRDHPLGASLQLDARALFLETLLHLLGLGLRDALLDVAGGVVDQVLGFLEAERGDLADDLDHIDLLVATRLEDDGELRLLLESGRRGTASSRRGSRDDRDVELLLEGLDQVGQLEHGLVADRVEDLFVAECSRHFDSSPGCLRGLLGLTLFAERL